MTRRRRKPKDPNKPKRSKYSLLCYRPASCDRARSYCSYDPIEVFMEKYHLTRKNIISLIEPGKRYLYVRWFRHRYYVGVHSDCLENFKYYCMYERKNHPAKRGNGRVPKHWETINDLNKILYPFWAT